MFESLKKKLAGWIGSGEKEDKKTKKSSKKAKSPKKDKTKKPKINKVSNSKKSKEKKIITEEKTPQVILEKEEKEEELVQAESAEVVEEEIEEEIQEEKEEIKSEGFFSKLFKKVTSSKISSEQFEEIFSELEIILLENNVALEVVDKIKEDLSKSLIGQEIKKQEAENKIIESLKKSIVDVLIEPPNLIDQIKKKDGVYTILFFGINGTGKTTSIAKLANKLKKSGIPCLLAAGDTFRAASIEQLQTHAEKIGVPIITQTYGSDPAAVAFDAISYAKKNKIKVVLIDTAGRMYTKLNLMKEMEKIIRISKPDLKIFVGESITGNDAIEQAKTFNETAGIDGIILSKADIDDKAGTILSVSYVTKKPIYFLGTGQTYDDLQDFKKETVIKNLGL